MFPVPQLATRLAAHRVGMLRFVRDLLFVPAVGLVQPAWADPVASASGACGSVKAALGQGTRCPDEYRCEVDETDDQKYFVVRIKSRCPAPRDAGPDWVGSSLVGYYGVRKRDGMVVAWNEAEGIAGPELPAKPSIPPR